MPLHNRYEIMTKSLNLVQPLRLFVKYFTAACCISWSLKVKDELKSFFELCMEINKWSQNTFLFNFGMHFHFNISNLNFQNAAELNTSKTVVEKLAKISLRWHSPSKGCVATATLPQVYMSDFKVRKVLPFVSLFIEMGREDDQLFVGLFFSGSKSNRKI